MTYIDGFIIQRIWLFSCFQTLSKFSDPTPAIFKGFCRFSCFKTLSVFKEFCHLSCLQTKVGGRKLGGLEGFPSELNTTGVQRGLRSGPVGLVRTDQTKTWQHVRRTRKKITSMTKVEYYIYNCFGHTVLHECAYGVNFICSSTCFQRFLHFSVLPQTMLALEGFLFP